LQVTTTDRLVLRWLTEEDAGFILELTNDPDWLRHIGDRGIRTLDDARKYIATGPAAGYARGGGLWAVELKESGAPIGICGLINRDWLEDVDVGFAFLPRYRGKGYAREAAAGTLAHARSALGLTRIAAIVSPENEASIRLLTQLGLGFERMARPPGDDEEVCVYAGAIA
jgi:RimJ/RimL family protein N-acetyltransferase